MVSVAKSAPNPAQKETAFAFERIATHNDQRPIEAQAVASGSTTPTQTNTRTAGPERNSYIRTRVFSSSTHPSSTPSSSKPAKFLEPSSPSHPPYGQLGRAGGVGGLPRQRAHSSFSPTAPPPRPHSITPPLPPSHPLAKRRGTIGPKPLSLYIPTELAATPTGRNAGKRAPNPIAINDQLHSPAPSTPAAFFDVLHAPQFNADESSSASGSETGSHSESEEEVEEADEVGQTEEEYTPLPRSPFITSPLGPGHFRGPSRMPSPISPLSPLSKSPFSPANYPDPYPSQTSSGVTVSSFWAHAKGAQSTPTIATAKRSLFAPLSPVLAALSPTFSKFKSAIGRKGGKKPQPHISSPVPGSIRVIQKQEMRGTNTNTSASDSWSGASSGPVPAHTLPDELPSPGMLSPLPANANWCPDMFSPAPTTPGYTFSPTTVEYPPSPITPLSLLSPGLLSPGGHPLPAPLSPRLLSRSPHDRELGLDHGADEDCAQEGSVIEKQLEKEARRGLKRDKDGRVTAWVSSQLSLSLLSTSIEAALGPTANTNPAVNMHAGVAEVAAAAAVPHRASEDSMRSGNVQELDDLLVRHMEDERVRFKRIASGSGSMRGSASFASVAVGMGVPV